MRKATINVGFADLLELSIKAIDFLDDIVLQKLEQYNNDQSEILKTIIAETGSGWLTWFLIKIGFYEDTQEYVKHLEECKLVGVNNSMYKIFRDEVFSFNASKEKQEAINVSKSIKYLAKSYVDANTNVEIDVVILAIIKKLANKEDVN